MKKILVIVLSILVLSSCYRCMDCQLYDTSGNALVMQRRCGFSEKHIKEKIDKSTTGDLDHDLVDCQ